MDSTTTEDVINKWVLLYGFLIYAACIITIFFIIYWMIQCFYYKRCCAKKMSDIESNMDHNLFINYEENDPLLNFSSSSSENDIDYYDKFKKRFPIKYEVILSDEDENN